MTEQQADTKQTSIGQADLPLPDGGREGKADLAGDADAERILIIDGNSLINRAYYAMHKPMITAEGIYTQGIYGFLNMLHKLQNDYKPAYQAVAFDLKAPTFRHLEYDGYKAGRHAMPPELVMQLPLLKEILQAMRIAVLELEGYEADDILGTVAKAAEARGIDPYIITGDKDALQLATHRTRIVIMRQGISVFDLYDYDRMLEDYHLTPTQFIDLKGLMGDKSDNLPGIPGIGEKRGIQLLQQFGSLEEMLRRTDEISSPSLRQNVEEYAQQAMMSKRLATIVTDVPIELDFEAMRTKEPDYAHLEALFTKLEFRTFLRRLLRHTPASAEAEALPPVDAKGQVLKAASQLDALKVLETLGGDTPVFLKVFGEGDHVAGPRIDGIFLSAGGQAFYLETAGIGIAAIIDWMNAHPLPLLGHELKDDLFMLMYHGLKTCQPVYDTAIAAYVLDSSRNRYDLPTLALEQLHVQLPSMEDFLAESGQIDLFSDAGLQYVDYGLKLEQVVRQLMPIQKAELSSKELEALFYDVEMPLIEVMAAMEVSGVAVNASFLAAFGDELRGQITDLEQEIYAYAGGPFNINSPAKLGTVLFETLGLPAGKKSKRGYSTSAEVLEKIRPLHPIVDKVLTYRNLSKLLSTYVEGMKPLICADGRIRAHFQQTVTATGRISCTEPNLQNIPIRQELGRRLRQAFVAEEGHVLVGADYSQIELRILAHLSGDEELIDAFNRGDDIHKLTASRVLGVPFDEVTLEQRTRAKAVNFGVIYGMSSFGLSENLNISRKEAEDYIQDYFRIHEKVKDYMDGQIALCRSRGYSTTLLGRRRAIPEIHASNHTLRQFGERLAMNSPIQGTAADIIKIAMNLVYRDLREACPDAKLILQVHDELIIEVPEADAEAVQALLVRNMESAMDLRVRLKAEPACGKSWFDLK